MTKFINTILISLLLISIYSCEPSGKKPSDMSPQELVKSREIRKISEIEILEAGKSVGLRLMKLIDSKIQFSNTSDSIDFQNLLTVYNEVKIDSIFNKLNVSIKLVIISSSLEANRSSPIEGQILEACKYSLENDIPISETVQISSDKKNVLYIDPIVIRKELIGLWSLKIPKKSIITSMD